MPGLFMAALANLVAAAPALADVTGVIAALPEDLKVLYEDAPQTVLAGPLNGFTPKAVPCRWCHSESDQGNP